MATGVQDSIPIHFQEKRPIRISNRFQEILANESQREGNVSKGAEPCRLGLCQRIGRGGGGGGREGGEKEDDKKEAQRERKDDDPNQKEMEPVPYERRAHDVATPAAIFQTPTLPSPPPAHLNIATVNIDTKAYAY